MNSESSSDNASSQNRDEIRAKQLANLKPFQPGQSGNPGGRPKRKRLTELCDELLEEKLGKPETREQLKDALWGKLLSSRVVGAMTMDQVWDRTEGKVTQQLELSGEVALTLSDRMAKARQRAKESK